MSALLYKLLDNKWTSTEEDIVSFARRFDVVAAVLLVIGGLNWGLVGFFNLDLVAAALGDASLISKSVYGLVGLSGLYQALQWRAIQRRWSLWAVPSR
jgi:uncharacterized membrane protein YuzA (DUF378 family)